MYNIDNVTYKFKIKKPIINNDIYKKHWLIIKNKPKTSYEMTQYIFYIDYYINKKNNSYIHKIEKILS
jgi:hypothetical protein